jgi:hypothetical protein
MSVRLSVWAMLGRFFQSLPVPCGMFWGVGEGRAWWSTGLGGPARVGEGGHGRGVANTGGGGHRRGRTERGVASTGGEGPGGGELDGCIMHRVHTILVCSIETMKFQFASLMNTFRSNIEWMPIMLGVSLGSKTWSWPSNFMKTILGNVDETSVVYPKFSSMTWWCVVAISNN